MMGNHARGRLANGAGSHGRAGLLVGTTALLLAGTSAQCLAQSATPGATMLDTIFVEAGANEPIAERFGALPGGVALVI
ncbi:MAG: hypothetical protein WBA88_07580, partial [Pseudaminobacter sp.]